MSKKDDKKVDIKDDPWYYELYPDYLIKRDELVRYPSKVIKSEKSEE